MRMANDGQNKKEKQNKKIKWNEINSISFFIFSFRPRPLCRIDANHIRFQIVWEYTFFSLDLNLKTSINNEILA